MKEIYLVVRESIEGGTENVWAFTDRDRAERYVDEMNATASKYLTYYVEEISVDQI